MVGQLLREGLAVGFSTFPNSFGRVLSHGHFVVENRGIVGELWVECWSDDLGNVVGNLGMVRKSTRTDVEFLDDPGIIMHMLIVPRLVRNYHFSVLGQPSILRIDCFLRAHK